jgi:hypothetical protein
VCLGRHRPPTITPDDEPLMRHIMRQVARDIPRAEWTEGQETPPAHRLQALLDWLVQKDYLRLTNPLEERFDVTERGQALVDRWSNSGA